jgi:hypothetical protein
MYDEVHQSFLPGCFFGRAPAVVCAFCQSQDVIPTLKALCIDTLGLKSVVTEAMDGSVRFFCKQTQAEISFSWPMLSGRRVLER